MGGDLTGSGGLCVTLIQMRLSVGRNNSPRARLNRHTSMSGIANSTQLVAMTARACDKRGGPGKESSLGCGAARGRGGSRGSV